MLCKYKKLTTVIVASTTTDFTSDTSVNSFSTEEKIPKPDEDVRNRFP